MNSGFQLRHGEDGYPISRFITHQAMTLGLSRRDLACRLGYQKISNGHRALAEALTTGKVPIHMWRHLGQALEIEQAVLDAVMESTARQHRDEAAVQCLARETDYRAVFKPHLRFTTRCPIPKPTSSSAALSWGRLRRVQLSDEEWKTNIEGRSLLVKRTILDHYASHNERLRSYGGIASYFLIATCGYGVDFGAEFDPDSNQTGPMQPMSRSWP